jgi:hypothetical protein
VSAAPRHSPRTNKQNVGTHGGDLLLNLLLRPLTDSDHRDDRTHADNDAQHGESGAHLIASQSPRGDSSYSD